MTSNASDGGGLRERKPYILDLSDVGISKDTAAVFEYLVHQLRSFAKGRMIPNDLIYMGVAWDYQTALELNHQCRPAPATVERDAVIQAARHAYQWLDDRKSEIPPSCRELIAELRDALKSEGGKG